MDKEKANGGENGRRNEREGKKGNERGRGSAAGHSVTKFRERKNMSEQTERNESMEVKVR